MTTTATRICPRCNSGGMLTRDQDGDLGCYGCGWVQRPAVVLDTPEREVTLPRGPRTPPKESKLLDVIARRPGLTVPQIAERVGFAEQTVRQMLLTLLESELVSRSDVQPYRYWIRGEEA